MLLDSDKPYTSSCEMTLIFKDGKMIETELFSYGDTHEEATKRMYDAVKNGKSMIGNPNYIWKCDSASVVCSELTAIFHEEIQTYETK